VNIGEPRRVIEIVPVSLPLPGEVPLPVPEPDPVLDPEQVPGDPAHVRA
jgi:hypothetical protein